MQHPKDGVEGTCKGSNKSKVENICLRLTQLRSSVTTSMMEHCLPSLLDTPHRRERAKQGLPVDKLCQGDVIFDTVSYVESGCLSGNLARVMAVGSSANHVLISKAVLGSLGVTYEQQCVSRPSEYCHFICPGSSREPIPIGDDQIFDVTEYLPKENEPVPGIWHLPGLPVTKSEPEQVLVRPLTSPGQPQAPTQHEQITPAPCLAKGSRIQGTTRSGRVILKPNYYQS